MASSTQAIADLRVFLGSDDGTLVTGASPAYGGTDTLDCLEISRSAGGRRLDYARFTYRIDKTGQRLVDLTTPTGWARQIEVRKYLNDTAPGDPSEEFEVLFWGDLDVQRFRIPGGPEQESVEVIATVRPYHFGSVSRGMLVWDPRADAEYETPEDILFNPLIDGVVEGNQSNKTDDDEKHFLWADPESFRTTEAGTYQAATRSRWDLRDAVEALCWACNPDEEFVKNPDIPDVLTDTIWEDAPDPENVRLPRGKHLPYYLDALLHPYGYDWFVELTQSESNPTTSERRISIFKRDEGDETHVSMQRPDEGLEFDFEATNCSEVGLLIDVGNVANEVVCEGSRKQHEIGFELYRCWPEADDALSEYQLSKEDATSEYNAGKINVWRKWAANEAGDYNSLRTTVAPIPAAPRDWTAFGVKFPRRRRAEDCLTRGENGSRIPPTLYWSSDGGTTKEPVPDAEWNASLLDTEIGVYFNGNTPPSELISAGDDARLYLCCTITGDDRITSTAEKRTETPNRRLSVLYVDVSDRYHYRQVQDTGSPLDYASVVSGDSVDEADDQAALDTLAELIRNNEEAARTDGSFAVVGIDTSYAISDLLTEVQGRSISLNRNAEGAPTAKYPQVVGISYFPQEQRTELRTMPQELDPFYQPGTRPGEPGGPRRRVR